MLGIEGIRHEYNEISGDFLRGLSLIALHNPFSFVVYYWI